MWVLDYAIRITEDSDNQGSDNQGPTVLGGFGILILETVISVVCILTLLGETDWERGGSATGDELFLQSKLYPVVIIHQNMAKK